MRRTRSIFGDPGRIAPSVAKGWRDDFIVELRLQSVPGEQIGDELMTVETHVAEAGEPAAQVFGEAKVYGREIAVATGAAGRGPSVGTATAVSAVLGLTGMLLTVRAFSSWLEVGPVDVTTGELVGLGLLLALASALLFTRTLRSVVEHPWLAMLFPTLLIGALVGVFALLADPLFAVPTLPLGGVGLVMLVVGTVVTWFDVGDSTDEITAPGEVPSSGRRGRLLAVLAFPLMMVLVLTHVWILHALTS